MAIGTWTKISGYPYPICAMHCGYFHSEIYYYNHLVKVFFSSLCLSYSFFLSLYCFIFRSPRQKAQTETDFSLNQLLHFIIIATTAATHHHRHSFTTFCFVSRKSFCVILKIGICSFIFPLIITAYDVLLFFNFFPFFFYTDIHKNIEQFIWTCF